MPYRRLPNTDQARLRAIEAALDKSKSTTVGRLAFSQLTLDRLQLLYPRFLSVVRQLDSAKRDQFNKSCEYSQIVRRVKLYLSHFLQVLTFAIIREELKPEIRSHYGLDPASLKIPAIEVEQDIIEWGEKIIAGEQQRCMKGGSPIYSPSIALVKVHYESFASTYHNQKILQSIVDCASEQVRKLRMETDMLIQKMWDETEASLRNLPEEKRRQLATEYGIQYVYRHYELKKIEVDNHETNMMLN